MGTVLSVLSVLGLWHPPHADAKKASAPASTYAQRADAMAFAHRLAQRQGIDLAWTRHSLGQARKLHSILPLMLPSPKGVTKNWAAYRARFIEPVRIRAGVRFWNQHHALLERAQRQYGVPAHIIMGILGVETIYGQNMGNVRVLDALATLTFDFPSTHPRAAQRQAYFQGELEEFLRQSWQQHTDPSQLRGSYAGAAGMPQFMPSSVQRWAVDFDGDGRIDLQHSAADAIGSVASYLKAHGWMNSMPTHYAVQVQPSAQLEPLLAPDIVPSFTPEEMAAQGVLVQDTGMFHPGPLALIALPQGGSAAHYVAGTENFYAITRYNWSSFYAMSVIELGQTIARVRAGQQ